MPVTTAEMAERLKATHLNPETPEEIEDAVEAEAPQLNAKHLREYTFQFKWKDGRGKLWEGKFTNKILSIKERQLVGIMRSRLAGGISGAVLDALTDELNMIVAHLAFSLQDKPEWANDLRSLDDPRLLQAIYEEVASHEAMFFGWS